MKPSENIEILRNYFGSYRASADYLGVSKDRYYQWKRNPESIPPQGKRLIELAVESVGNQQTETRHHEATNN